MKKYNADEQRVAKINEYHLLDLGLQQSFQNQVILFTRILNFPAAFISIIDQDKQWLIFSEGINIECTDRDLAFCNTVIASATTVFVPDTLTNNLFCQHPLVTGAPHIRSYFGIPLVLDEVVVGSLAAIDYQPRILDEATRETAAFVASTTEFLFKLQNARLHQEQEIQLLNNSSVVLVNWQQDNMLHISYISPNAQHVLGVSKEEIRHHCAMMESYVHPDDYENLLFALDNHKKGVANLECEYRFLSPGGKTLWIRQLSTANYHHNGKLSHVQALLIDNSHQKYLQKLLVDTNNQMRLVLESSSLGTWDWDLGRHTIRVNKQWCEMMGITQDQFDSSLDYWQQLMHPLDRENMVRAAEACATGQTTLINEQYRMRHSKGDWVWIETYGKVVEYNEKGKPIRVAGTHRDITEKKNKELQEEADKRLLELINRAQKIFLEKTDIQEACMSIFDDLLSISASEFGFIGQVREHENKKVLHIVAISNVSWNGDSKNSYDTFLQNKLQFTSLDNLFGHVVTTGKPLITNSPRAHSASRGVPKGHPILRQFMGLPIYFRNEVVGMIGLGNRFDGYNEQQLRFLSPFVDTLGSLFYALETQRAREELEAKLLEMANTDPLTGIHNRRAYILEAEKCYRNHEKNTALAIIDIDFFKKVNDQYGHHVGDVAICRLAEIITSKLRTDDFVARLGGEEFGLIMHHANPDNVDAIMNGIRIEVENTLFTVDGYSFHFTISIGATFIKHRHVQNLKDNFESDMKRADDALYEAKNAGRNRVVWK
ncbi:diguanylate cyclase [Dickeya oryzae]|uniref:diguanylate cyclase n=1 Tax=Dickeya oryzae TaxID=1240404 RepID=A0AB39ISC6_9GAMM|nr:diguanylate cyclase [Dickeya oryzae]MBP2849920.1 diguanylate cyclase [Dickeya oryzae]MCA6990149.1 diguanylate cyclase [Dickeya oryzae]